MSSGAEKVVCVTGASGYIASWLVKLLLQRGYTVNATVRHPDNPKKTEHLLALDGAKERLHLFKAELGEEGSFDSAVEGCVCVFHTASPVTFTATDPKVELIEPAVKGTLSVLKSCAKVHTIKRVVVTSSMATIMYNGRPLTEDTVIDETWSSDPAFCKKQELWYMLSKILAEEAAWKFAKENEIDMVFLNPGLVIGPLLQPTINFSTEVILGFITGVQVFPGTSYRLVDVRDVAYAHIQAFEVPSAKGRYCLVGHVVPTYNIWRFLRENYPSLVLPEKREEGEPAGRLYQVTKEKAESLGISFMPLEQSLRDTIESFKDKNFLSF